MKRLRIVLLVLAAACFALVGSGCSASDTDDHGVVRSSDGWF